MQDLALERTMIGICCALMKTALILFLRFRKDAYARCRSPSMFADATQARNRPASRWSCLLANSWNR